VTNTLTGLWVSRMSGCSPGYFDLPGSASKCQLRAAYVQRVKKVHPDAKGGKSTQEFLELQQMYGEALALLGRGQAQGQAPSRRFRHAGHGDRGRAGEAETGARVCAVPVVGWPPEVVYTAVAAALLLASVAGLRQRSPSVQEVSVRASAPADGGRPASFDHGLQSGPWNVPLSRSKNGVGTESYIKKLSGRARHRSLDYDHTPQLRKGIDVLPVHIAAEENSVFYLEQCGANPSCRSLLNAADARGDTPLHHAASHGAQQAAQALLRLGAEATRNRVGKFPEEVAQGPIAHLLAQSRGGTGGTRFASRHPDGLGVMQEPPPEAAVFTGLRHYDCLRQAVNMAAGCQIAPPLPVSREMRQNPSAAPRVVGIINAGIQDTGFQLVDSLADVSAGALLYEAPGKVSHDAGGHWVAVRRQRLASTDVYWRLDPLRGPFHLTAEEFAELSRRYPTWQLTSKTESAS
ncbi:unnamed protein product, partial [Effrenium voratum]